MYFKHLWKKQNVPGYITQHEVILLKEDFKFIWNLLEHFLDSNALNLKQAVLGVLEW